MAEFQEKDYFHNKLFHLAASLGAGDTILCYLIERVDIHARNASNQTFLQVMDQTPFFCNHGMENYEIKNFMKVLVPLLKAGFDFNTRDDFGQTFNGKLSPRDYFAAILGCKLYPFIHFYGHRTSPPLHRDFRGFSILKAGASRAKIAEAVTDAAQECSEGHISHRRYEEQLPYFHTLRRKERALGLHKNIQATIQRALSGFPETKYLRHNSIHCLAITCKTYKTEEAEGETPTGDSPRSKTTSKKREYTKEEPGRREKTLDELEQLLMVGVDPNEYDNQGHTPIMASFAILRGLDKIGNFSLELLNLWPSMVQMFIDKIRLARLLYTWPCCLVVLRL